jgi:hypothetical protein
VALLQYTAMLLLSTLLLLLLLLTLLLLAAWVEVTPAPSPYARRYVVHCMLLCLLTTRRYR